jgi:methylenetetrahydrofolate--tRNA-(uracil-5-)-methyltransferase
VADTIEIVGGGLAGCEAALFLAERGHPVRLFEMRPVRTTPAHKTDRLGELVCTNSFKSEDPTNAHGQLKREMEALGSLLVRVAGEARVAAGSALAVDRERFSAGMTEAVANHPLIEVARGERTELPDAPAIIATGPLTSDALSASIRAHLGDDGLSFYDAIAPIVHGDSLDRAVVFEAGRFGEDADYLNCPMDETEYESFLDALLAADVHHGHDFDTVPYFEGCLPVEVMASRGRDTLRFGPLKPVGLKDPRTGRRPHAVVQLRREDAQGQMWNLVGFQTRLRVAEQGRVFRMIPGLEQAEFLRWGSIHRNSYLNSPARLTSWGSLPHEPRVLFAGQLTGVEGYTESASSGLLAAVNLRRMLLGRGPTHPPVTTMMGGLVRYLREADPRHFQPMNSNWGLVEPLPVHLRHRKERREALAARALRDFLAWMDREEIGS